MQIERNKEAYESEEVIAYYKASQGLQKPEQTILGFLSPSLRQSRLLDIGVGGGRTTAFFASASEYVGIDYSAGMVMACQEKYPHLRFLVCDARDMRIFPDNYFDIVLFSYNGIDSFAHEDRLKALHEIHRVCNRTGWFVFSAHNLHYVPYHFRYLQIRPIRWPPWSHILGNLRRRASNPEWRSLPKKNHAIINDGANNFKLKNYYIDPESQIKQLQDVGFSHVRILSLGSGLEITNEAELENNRDPWLYYLCQKET